MVLLTEAELLTITEALRLASARHAEALRDKLLSCAGGDLMMQVYVDRRCHECSTPLDVRGVCPTCGAGSWHID